MATTHRTQKIVGNITLGIAGAVTLVIWAQTMLFVQQHGESPPKAPMVLHVATAGMLALVGLQLRITAGRTHVGASRWLALGLAALLTTAALRFVADYHWSLQLIYGIALAWIGLLAAYSGVSGARRRQAERARVAASHKASRAGAPFVVADVPIRDAKEERLGRLELVRVLARRLASYNGDRSLVVGMCGPWGSGKTSLTHLLTQEITRLAEADSRFVLGPVYLAPWVLSAADDLAPVLLQEIGRRVKGNPLGRDVDVDAGEQIIDLATTLAAAQTVVRADTQVMTGEYMLGDLVRATLAWVKGHTGDETLDIQSDRVSTVLRESGALLFVVLDDLERLSADQMAAVGRVMNYLGSFANTVYVASLDRERAEHALATRFGAVNGVLDRALHLTFDLPAPDPDALRAMVVKNVRRLQGNRPTLTMDAERLGVLWGRALGPLLDTPRDVAKLFASYNLALDAVGSTTEPIDLLALEALRVIEPRAHRELALGAASVLAADDDARSAILGAASERNREPVRALLDFVFPASGDSPPRGAAHTEHFPNYFRWSLANEIVGSSRGQD